jgi:hypothetical protein
MAAQNGYTSSIVGFYLPYADLFAQSADVVFTQPGMQKPSSIRGKVGLTLTDALRSLGDPVSRWVGHRLFLSQWSRHHYWLGRRAEAEAASALRRLGSGNLLLIHLPLPHGPFVFDSIGDYVGASATGRAEPSSTKYMAHLQYADAVLGRLLGILRETGTYDEAMVIVTSDHGWRTDPQLEAATSYEAVTHVPLVVKWPGQTERIDVHGEMCLTSLQRLMGPVEAGEDMAPDAQQLELLTSRSCDKRARLIDSLGWITAFKEDRR